MPKEKDYWVPYNNNKDKLRDYSYPWVYMETDSRIPNPLLYKIQTCSQAVMVHTFNPSTYGAEAGRPPGSRPAWAT